MKIQIDNRLIHTITKSKNAFDSLLSAIHKAGIMDENQAVQFILKWPAFLEYIHLGSLFESFPKFNEENKFFKLALSTLYLDNDQELLFHLFDQIFVECITQIKALPQIQQFFLIGQLRDKLQSSSEMEKEIFTFSLGRIEKSLVEHPYTTLHDLTLYLAWDLMCTNLAIIFEHATENINFIKGVSVLKDCLIESFLHISAQGKTFPSFFKLMEAIFAFLMREESLQTYNDTDWITLCQSSQALRSRDKVADVPYIDEAILQHHAKQNVNLSVFTMDSMDKIQAGLIMADYVYRLVKKAAPNWTRSFSRVEIISFKEMDTDLFIQGFISDNFA